MKKKNIAIIRFVFAVELFLLLKVLARLAFIILTIQPNYSFAVNCLMFLFSLLLSKLVCRQRFINFLAKKDNEVKDKLISFFISITILIVCGKLIYEILVWINTEAESIPQFLYNNLVCFLISLFALIIHTIVSFAIGTQLYDRVFRPWIEANLK